MIALLFVSFATVNESTLGNESMMRATLVLSLRLKIKHSRCTEVFLLFVMLSIDRSIDRSRISILCVLRVLCRSLYILSSSWSVRPTYNNKNHASSYFPAYDAYCYYIDLAICESERRNTLIFSSISYILVSL